jgi:hypothetical protein
VRAMLKDLRKIPFLVAIVLICLAVATELGGACLGFGIASLAMFDLFVLLTTALIAAPLILGNATVGRTQGLVTLIVSVLILLASLVMLFMAISLLFVMLGLLPFIPFYLAVFASFPKGAAAAVLSLAMLLKLGFALALIVAHQRFLENTGLVIIIAISLGLTLLVTFLHGFPRVFVSITDDIAAIIILIVTCLRALGFALAALPAIKKATGI